LQGHSDADVALHALCDALLGAAAAGDIGARFPDTDPQYKGVASLLLLERTHEIIGNRGFAVGNVDITIVAERPKLKDHMSAMKETIAQALQIAAEDVNIKATTTEGLGFAGREEGIAAFAVACLMKEKL
jgi:2-C-methyl-D-erythritol 2,4-cyclodiphosphate synthase